MAIHADHQSTPHLFDKLIKRKYNAELHHNMSSRSLNRQKLLDKTEHVRTQQDLDRVNKLQEEILTRDIESIRDSADRLKRMAVAHLKHNRIAESLVATRVSDMLQRRIRSLETLPPNPIEFKAFEQNQRSVSWLKDRVIEAFGTDLPWDPNIEPPSHFIGGFDPYGNAYK